MTTRLPFACHSIRGFGPFDDDFDPFEDENEASVLIPLD